MAVSSIIINACCPIFSDCESLGTDFSQKEETERNNATSESHTSAYCDLTESLSVLLDASRKKIK